MTLVRLLIVLALITLTSACATYSEREEAQPSQVEAQVDPWEGFNRKMFSFNSTLDRWVLKPAAKGYDFVLPSFVKVGVGNFFRNIAEVGNIGNDILQWKWKQAGTDSGRLLVNTTIGLAGLFDVASEIGLEEDDGEDVGQTFEKWGIKQGPYLVLPFFGPSTVREAFAKPVDLLLDPVTYVDDSATRIGLSATRFVHQRYELFDVEDLVSGDEYLFIRDAYLQRRQYLYDDGVIDENYEDDFGEEDF